MPQPRKLQKMSGILLAVIVVLLVGNSAFLLVRAEADAFVGWMIQAHVWLGLALCVAVPAFVWPHLLMHWHHRNGRAKWIGIVLVSLLTAGCLLGLGLWWVGKSSAVAWLVWAHILVFLLALGGYMAHRLAAYMTPVLWAELGGGAVAGVVLLLLWTVDSPYRQGGSVYDDPQFVRAPAQYGQTRARIPDGHWLKPGDLLNSNYCAECHVEIAQQWERSPHRFSSMNDPFYNATFQNLQDNRPQDIIKFCAGCHDPTVLLEGHMDEGRIDLNTPNATVGISCLACHAITEVRDRVGIGGYVIEAPDHYPFFDSDDPQEQALNRQLIRSRPQQHKESFMKPFMKTSEYCLSCHKASLNREITEYKWRPGQNDFDPWHDSPSGGQSSLNFYDTTQIQSCQDCHMPMVPTNDPAAKNGLTRDHTFAAANTALPFVVDKPAWLAQSQAMLKDVCTIDLFSLLINPDQPDQRRAFPLEHPDLLVPVDQRVHLEVVVRNRKAGHTFPAGVNDLQQAWVQLFVHNQAGELILQSGSIDPDSLRVDPWAHTFETVLLTREGRLMDIHNVENIYTLLFNHSLPQDVPDVIAYDFTLPPGVKPGDRLTVTAKIQYRTFRRMYTEYVLGPNAPAMPITQIAEDQVTLTVGPSASPAPPHPELSPELAERLNDLGIGLMRRGDNRTANWAFTQVARALPQDPNPWVNQARVLLNEGRLSEVEPVLRNANQLKPGYAKTAFFVGELRSRQGQHEQAVAAYDVALAQFPNDRQVINARGSALFKLERYDQAIEAFYDALRVDPSNLTAHAMLFRSYAAKGDQANAARYEERYLEFRPERTEMNIVGEYRRRNEHHDLRANLQHVLPLSPHIMPVRADVEPFNIRHRPNPHVMPLPPHLTPRNGSPEMSDARPPAQAGTPTTYP